MDLKTHKIEVDGGETLEHVAPIVDLVRNLLAHISRIRDQLVRKPLASTFGERRQLKRLGISAPPPYYVVPVQQRVRVVPPEPVVSPEPEPIDWSHRWDVRGHERVMLKRGSLPMDGTDERVLALRGWRIYAHGAPIPSDDAWRLAIRDFEPPTSGEWVAMHSAWVRPHVKGPESKPYVPALRVVE